MFKLDTPENRAKVAQMLRAHNFIEANKDWFIKLLTDPSWEYTVDRLRDIRTAWNASQGE